MEEILGNCSTTSANGSANFTGQARQLGAGHEDRQTIKSAQEGTFLKLQKYIKNARVRVRSAPNSIQFTIPAPSSHHTFSIKC